MPTVLVLGQSVRVVAPDSPQVGRVGVVVALFEKEDEPSIPRPGQTPRPTRGRMAWVSFGDTGPSRFGPVELRVPFRPDEVDVVG